MKGKSFTERLLVGGNVNVVSVDPVALDIAPQLGYKLTSSFFVGVGVSYRLAFRDSIESSRYISPSNASVDAFASYDILRSIFLYSEWKMSRSMVLEDDRVSAKWVNNCFVGAGKRILIHPKVYLVITALYNLNDDRSNPVYSKRFQIRMGFQLSELATRKKKVFYDPNR
jgi:hypothetical protein